MRIFLYGTSHCTLCDKAMEIIIPLQQSHGISIEHIDIALDDELFNRYATTIPTLRIEEREIELHWPFGLLDVINLIE